MPVHEHHVVHFGTGRLEALVDAIGTRGKTAVDTEGGNLFGIWKGLIGLSLNHLVVLTEWPDEAAARAGANAVLSGIDGLTVEQHDLWLPTLRPLPGARPPSEPGFVSHRWFDIREADVERFLELSGNTWRNWEGVHDGQVIGLWRTAWPMAPGIVRMRLMAWYRSMAAWESSRHWRGTKGAETANQNLGARYNLNIDSAVSILRTVT